MAKKLKVQYEFSSLFMQTRYMESIHITGSGIRNKAFLEELHELLVRFS